MKSWPRLINVGLGKSEDFKGSKLMSPQQKLRPSEILMNSLLEIFCDVDDSADVYAA